MKKGFCLILTILYTFSATCAFASAGSKIVLPLFSKSQALAVASEYITKMQPQLITELDTENEFDIKYNKSAPYGYNITFPRIINKIPYNTDCVKMFVDGTNGNVSNFIVSFNSEIVPSTAETLISQKDAEEKFISAMGLELRFNKIIKNNSVQTYLTYTAKEDFLINAETGNTIPLPYTLPTDGYFDITHMSEKTSGSTYFDMSVLSTDQADTIARNIPEFGITDEYNTISANYLRSNDGTYLITMSYLSGTASKTVTVNAINGAPVEFENSTMLLTNSAKSDQTETINGFAENYYAEYLDKTVRYQTSTEDYTVCLYERQIDGIPYKSNGIYICFDNYGTLRYVSFAWDNAKFKIPDEMISTEDAYKMFFQRCGLELSYFKRDNNQLTPVYKKSSEGTGIIDASTGRQLNYDGSYYYSEKTLNYLGLNTHYAAEAAEKLSNCDIYVSSGGVFLNDNISQQEYLLLISELISGTKPILNTTGILTDDQREMLYKYMISEGILTNDEVAYTNYVTRADAVKYLIRVLGYGVVGDMSEIFIRHFSDTDTIPEQLVGYIELARSMGIVNGHGDNTFRPNEYVTNGDSLIMVYNYLRR